ncbi:hypothetical protein CHARACLAT_027274 [Characodon lateralis]|uniref:Uncharacterized protein n=1 Tax=Characodon lateralis TaxID=208331 RepID=A0ABU7CTT4_9TELE|nr:hypothetical protein [Characodon lateralis]
MQVYTRTDRVVAGESQGHTHTHTYNRDTGQKKDYHLGTNELEKACKHLTQMFTYISFDMYKIFTFIHPYGDTHIHTHTQFALFLSVNTLIHVHTLKYSTYSFYTKYLIPDR